MGNNFINLIYKMNLLDKKKSHYLDEITKCEKKKCKKTYKRKWKESSRYTRALHKKCDKSKTFYQCRETVDRSKTNASNDAHTQCEAQKCKKEYRKFHNFTRSLHKCMRRS